MCTKYLFTISTRTSQFCLLLFMITERKDSQVFIPCFHDCSETHLSVLFYLVKPAGIIFMLSLPSIYEIGTPAAHSSPRDNRFKALPSQKIWSFRSSTNYDQLGKVVSRGNHESKYQRAEEYR